MDEYSIVMPSKCDECLSTVKPFVHLTCNHVLCQSCWINYYRDTKTCGTCIRNKLPVYNK